MGQKGGADVVQRCREHPMHSQINLESYLLLPIQRVPRYKLLVSFRLVPAM